MKKCNRCDSTNLELSREFYTWNTPQDKPKTHFKYLICSNCKTYAHCNNPYVFVRNNDE